MSRFITLVWRRSLHWCAVTVAAQYVTTMGAQCTQNRLGKVVVRSSHQASLFQCCPAAPAWDAAAVTGAQPLPSAERRRASLSQVWEPQRQTLPTAVSAPWKHPWLALLPCPALPAARTVHLQRCAAEVRTCGLKPTKLCDATLYVNGLHMHQTYTWMHLITISTSIFSMTAYDVRS